MLNAMWMLVIALGTAGLMAAAARRRIEDCFAASFFGMIAVLYAFALAGVPVWGYHAVRALGCAAFAAAAVLLLLRRDRRKYVFTPGLMVFVAFVFIAWWAHRGQAYMHFDEFTHWGRAPNRLYALEVLPNTVAGALDYSSYPPASTLFVTFWSWLGGSFSEGSTLTAMNVLMFSCFMPILKHAAWNRWKRILPAALICLLIPMVYHAAAYQTMYVDSLMGSVAAYALILWFTSERSASNAAFIGGAMFVLPLIKAAGAGVMALCLGVMVLDAACTRKQSFWRFFIFPAICLAVAVISWNLFLNAHGIVSEKPFRSWEIAENIRHFFNGTAPAYQGYMVKNLFYHMTNPEMMGASHILKLSYVEWLGVFAVIACALNRQRADDGMLCTETRRFGRAVIAMMSMTLLYMVFLFHIYLYSFGAAEAAPLHSFDRYMCTIMTAALGTTAALIVHHPWKKTVFSLPVSVTVLACLALMVNPVGVMDLTFNAPAQIEKTQIERASHTPPVYAVEAVNAGDRVAWISCEGMEMTWMSYIVGRYEFVPADLSGPLGMEITGTPESAQKTLTGFDYAYVCHVDDAFREKYGILFENQDEIAEKTLYRVSAEGESVTLVKELRQ